jgi:hypothetical protein
MLVSGMIYALALATFFLVDEPWYVALALAIAVLFAATLVRALCEAFAGSRRIDAALSDGRRFEANRGDSTPP